MGNSDSNRMIIVIFGASGDLARKKTFPSLWTLYKQGKLPTDTRIVAFARSKLDVTTLVGNFKPFCKNISDDDFGKFCSLLEYFQGEYGSSSSMEEFGSKLFQLEEKSLFSLNKIFYLTLPPNVYIPVTKSIKDHLIHEKSSGWSRIIIEKPFGVDLSSSNELSNHLKGLYPENLIYRIDHYLGKEMVQNLLVLRFANVIFENLWNRKNISCVLITLKEDFGTFGRGGYYDQSGVVRDIIQNHSIQLLSLVAMEPPTSLEAESIKNAKVRVLKCIESIEETNVVLGQYVGDKNASPTSPQYKGYKDDPSVPADSKTPTFVSLVCYINNERWKDVPFIVKAGKALNERKGEIRIQFKGVEPSLFGEEYPKNELVIKLQPNEAIHARFQAKIPGLDFKLSTAELDLFYNKHFESHTTYDAYEKLILDVIAGSNINFVRSDELKRSWKIFDKILKKIDDGQLPIYEYEFGTRGPVEADQLAHRVGFRFDSKYQRNI